MTSTTASPDSATELSPKLVYLFGDGRAEGGAGMRELLGGKGAGLSEMSSLGIPVPPGLTITTEVCSAFYANGQQYPDGLDEQVRAGIAVPGDEQGVLLHGRGRATARRVPCEIAGERIARVEQGGITSGCRRTLGAGTAAGNERRRDRSRNDGVYE